MLRTAPAPVDLEESLLLGRVAAGEHGDALRALYRRYEGRLYGFGLRLLGDRGLAEELVQETFVRLWQAAPRYDAARGTVRGLLFTIARRAAVDLCRRPSSRPLAPALDDAGAIDARADEVLLAVTVRDAMMALSDTHREVLELAYEEDLKLEDIATRLGVPLGTVKSRVYYALRELRRALAERGFDG